MSDLIKALQILLKYGDPKFPTCCEHDELFVHVVHPDMVSDEDIVALETLGFHVNEGLGCFSSFRFGSC